MSREHVRVLGGIKTAERPLARPRQQAVVPVAAGSEPNSSELRFPRSATSAASRAIRPGWQCRSARSDPFATDNGGKHCRSRVEAAVSGEGGVGVEHGSMR
jgi:hypothetical protein